MITIKEIKPLLEKGLSQKKIAEFFGVSHQAINFVCTGRRTHCSTTKLLRTEREYYIDIFSLINPLNFLNVVKRYKYYINQKYPELHCDIESMIFDFIYSKPKKSKFYQWLINKPTNITIEACLYNSLKYYTSNIFQRVLKNKDVYLEDINVKQSIF